MKILIFQKIPLVFRFLKFTILFVFNGVFLNCFLPVISCVLLGGGFLRWLDDRLLLEIKKKMYINYHDEMNDIFVGI
jgi:hypothetical protein